MKSNSKIGRKDENIKQEYDVVYVDMWTDNTYNCINKLKKDVNIRCEEGWIPEGTVSFIKDKTFEKGGYLCQTIIRPVAVSDSEEPKITLSEKPSIRPAYDNISIMNEF